MDDSELELHWTPSRADWADSLYASVPTYRFALRFAAVLNAGAWALLLLYHQLAPGFFGLAASVAIAVLPTAAVWVEFHRNPVAATAMTASADNRSVRLMAEDGTAYSELEWAKLAGWRQTRRGFILYTGTGRANSYYPVPFRAFDSPEQREQFRALLTQRVGPQLRA